MAKNSFILGATRGAIGNIVVRRANGQTVISSKPTQVANPRTFAQAENRMRLAAVSKFYSPLSSYLEQGVQGKSTQASQSDFSSYNIRLMREQGLSVPKGADWFPLPLRLAKGSVAPVIAVSTSWRQGAVTIFVDDGLGALSEDITTFGALARFFKTRHNIPVDKFQLTIVAAYSQPGASANFTYYPYVERVMLNTASTAGLSKVGRFEFLTGGTGDDNYAFEVAGSGIYFCVGIALIISYYDGKKWVRSTADLMVDPSIIAASQLAYDANVATYMDSAESSDPDGRVYLDGYTRRAGGGGGSDIDLSQFSYFYGTSATTAKAVALTTAPLTVSGSTVQVLALEMSDMSVKVLTGGDRMSSAGKAFPAAGGSKVTLTSAQVGEAVSVSDSSSQYYNFYAWVAEQSGLPLSYFMTE